MTIVGHIMQDASTLKTPPDEPRVPPRLSEPLRSINEMNSAIRRVRQHDRFLTSIRVIVYRGMEFQTCTITNLSTYGAGLDRTLGLHAGETVEISLLSGHRFGATVQWTLGRRCGVRFERPLSDTDPLVTEASKRRRLIA